ncbi:unnamed protein product [Closterium sp. NIES-54]
MLWSVADQRVVESRDVVFHEGLSYKGWKERGASIVGSSLQDPYTSSIVEGAWEDPGEEVQEQQEEQKAAAPHHEESPTAGSTPDPNAPAHDPEQPPQQHTPPVPVGRWQQLLQQQLPKSPRSPMKRVTWREKLQSLEQGEASPLRRTTRISRPPERFTPSAQYACMHDHEVHDLEECMLVDADGGAHGLDFCLMGQVHEPKSVKEALSRPEWVESMHEELESHKVNEFFELVDLACVPPGMEEGVWLKRLFGEFGHELASGVPVFVDNKSAIALAHNACLHGRTKHMQVRWHFIREMVASGEVILRWCRTNRQAADILTKSLPFEWHGTSTPRPPTPSVPLTKLLGRRGLTGTRLLLALATTKASTLRGCTSTSTTATATSAIAAAASTTSADASTTSTAATEAPTPGTTSTSTATPSASSTASAATPAVSSTTLAPLALAVAAPPTRSRRSLDLLSANEVDSSSRSNRGEKGDRGTPLKEGGATVAARSTYS